MTSYQPDMKLRLLLAAKKLFARQGYEGTSVRQICEEAGGNVALVSYHFGGKENIFFSLFDTFFPARKEVFEEYAEVLDHPVEGIKLLIREVIRFRMEDPEMASILQQEIMMQSSRIAGIQEYAFPVWQKLREMLARGKEQGIFQFRSLDYAMLFIMGVLVFPKCNPFIEPLLTEGPQKMEDVIEDTTQFVLGGLGFQSSIKN